MKWGRVNKHESKILDKDANFTFDFMRLAAVPWPIVLRWRLESYPEPVRGRSGRSWNSYRDKEAEDGAALLNTSRPTPFSPPAVLGFHDLDVVYMLEKMTVAHDRLRI